jgi:ABC-type branched-subunit amino acid transport system ATPase component
MDVIMAFSDEIYVLADGQVIAQGTPDEIQKNRQVLDAYLGESPDQA